MSNLFTYDELRQVEHACHLAGFNGLANKVRDLVMDEQRANGYTVMFATTRRQLVKQMILDSPLARVPDTQQPLDVITVAIALPYLRRLIEAVEAL